MAKTLKLRLDKASQQAKKESQEQERESELCPLPVLGVPQNHTANNHNIHRGPGVIPCRLHFPPFFSMYVDVSPA